MILYLRHEITDPVILSNTIKVRVEYDVTAHHEPEVNYYQLDVNSSVVVSSVLVDSDGEEWPLLPVVAQVTYDQWADTHCGDIEAELYDAARGKAVGYRGEDW